MPEQIIITFAPNEQGGQDVGIQYHQATSEAVMRDEMLAKELALHALTVQVIQHRENDGLPVPQALITVRDAHTFRDLM